MGRNALIRRHDFLGGADFLTLLIFQILRGFSDIFPAMVGFHDAERCASEWPEFIHFVVSPLVFRHHGMVPLRSYFYGRFAELTYCARITTNILGLRATSPGFRSFSFLPHLSEPSILHLSGSVTSPAGVIRAEVNHPKGVLSIVVPYNCNALIGVPKVRIVLPRLFTQLCLLLVANRSCSWEKCCAT